MPVMSGFRVTQDQYRKIKEYAERSGRPLSDIFREAVMEHIDREQDLEDDSYFLKRMAERDKKIVGALKAIENRFAVLLVRLGIDLESMVALNWATADPATKTELFEKCQATGVKRFRRAMNGLEKDMVAGLKHLGETIEEEEKEPKSKGKATP